MESIILSDISFLQVALGRGSDVKCNLEYLKKIPWIFRNGVGPREVLAFLVEESSQRAFAWLSSSFLPLKLPI